MIFLIFCFNCVFTPLYIPLKFYSLMNLVAEPLGDDVVKEAMAQLDRIEKDIDMQVRKFKY